MGHVLSLLPAPLWRLVGIPELDPSFRMKLTPNNSLSDNDVAISNIAGYDD
jgi:hypothetical protein